MGKRIKFKAGDLVFAQVRGFPFWPARVSRRLRTNKFQVFFYGTYETSYLKASQLVHLTPENKEEFSTKNSKKLGYLQGIEEIEHTPEIAPVFADEEIDPTEGTTPKNIKKTPQTKTPNSISAKSKPGPGRPRKLSSGGATPMGRGIGKRKADGSGADPAAKRARIASDAAVEPEKISRGGRKIKPNHKWAEDGLITAKLDTGSPGAAAHEISNNEADFEGNSHTHVKYGVNEATEKVIDLKVKKKGFMKKGNIKGKKMKRAMKMGGSANKVLMEHVPKTLFAIVKKTGDLVALEVEKNKPDKFGSSEQKIEWEKSAVAKAIELKKDIEDGVKNPPEEAQCLSEEIVFTNEDKKIFAQLQKKAVQIEEKKNMLDHFRIEKNLQLLDDAIEEILDSGIAEPERCLESLEELQKLPLTPLILKKHPDIVQLIKQLWKHGIDTNQTSPVDNKVNKAIPIINKKAEDIVEHFKTIFNYEECYEGQDFFVEYKRQVAEFEEKTKDMDEMEVLGLITDPTI